MTPDLFDPYAGVHVEDDGTIAMWCPLCLAYGFPFATVDEAAAAYMDHDEHKCLGYVSTATLDMMEQEP